jgi:phage-related protein
MTSAASTDVKEVIFINQDVVGEFAALPDEVKEAADFRISIVQNGGRLPAAHVRKLRGQLAGISEIRAGYNDDTYRVYFAAEFEKALYLLDAGIKKSPKGGEIPRWQIERLQARMSQARAHYERCAAAIEDRFQARRAARFALQAAAEALHGDDLP